MKEKLKFYTPKEKSSLWFYPLAAIFIFFIAPLLSIVYTELQQFNEFVILGILIFLGFLFAMYFLINIMLEFTRVSDGKLSNGFSWLFIIVFYYLHWSAYLYVAMHKVFDTYGMQMSVNLDSSPDHYFSLAMHPSTMWTYMTLDASFGTWVLWFIELLGFLFVAIISGVEIKIEPYSDIRSEDFKKTVIPVNQISKEIFISSIEERDYENIKFIEEHFVGHESYSKIYIYTSPNEQSYLSLINVKADISKGGEAKFDEEMLIRNIAIDDELKTLLMRIREGYTDKKSADNTSNTNKIEELEQPNEKVAEVKQEIVKEGNRIEKPEIVFNSNEGSGGYIFSILSIIIGLGLLFASIIYDLSSIWLYLITFYIAGSGFWGIIQKMGISKSDLKAVIKMNPSRINIKAIISNHNRDVVFDINDIDRIGNNEEVFNKRRSNYIYKTTIYLKSKKDQEFDLVIIEMNNIDVNLNEFENKLNLLIGARIKERIKILENWKQKK